MSELACRRHCIIRISYGMRNFVFEISLISLDLRRQIYGSVNLTQPGRSLARPTGEEVSLAGAVVGRRGQVSARREATSASRRRVQPAGAEDSRAELLSGERIFALPRHV